MIDWLASKIGTLIAIGVITGFILALFAWQHGVIVDREGQAVADNIADNIDSLAGLNAAIKLNTTFGNEGGQLPYTINGEDYEINITKNMVIIIQGQKQWISHFIEPVICQDLTDVSFNYTTYNSLIIDNNYINIEVGEPFYIERQGISIDGDNKYVIQIYL